MTASPIRRFSSGRTDDGRLDGGFLAKRLAGATAYRRIAGYFRSSIFELIGEEIAQVPRVQIVCNSEVDSGDLAVSQSAMVRRLNEASPDLASLLVRERYRRLDALLRAGNVEIRVVPRDHTFVHGKAGVIDHPRGKSCFLGSANETRSGFAHNYEILWEDESPEGVAWVEEEFERLWRHARPLSEGILIEIGRAAARVEVTFAETPAEDVPAAALVESPIYRRGDQLQPWQRAFVAKFVDQRERRRQVRLLLADEVGLGKTLSLGACALATAILDPGPILILCPANLAKNWQAELQQHLGIPSAVWLSTQKRWLLNSEGELFGRGVEDVVRCPFRIGIVSTGLLTADSTERALLLERGRFALVILDEAHKARRSRGLGVREPEANNLLDFMLAVGPKTRHLLLGTATPIQTNVGELWDLLEVLNAGAEFVMGSALPRSPWLDPERAIPLMRGETVPERLDDLWEFVRNPLPPGDGPDAPLFLQLRHSLDVDAEAHISDMACSALPYHARAALEHMFDGGFFRLNNPIIRHTVLRKRATLEQRGLLARIAVDVHPDPARPLTDYPPVGLVGLALDTSLAFDQAYRTAMKFIESYSRRVNGGAMIKSVLLQRLCSSLASGLRTTRALLERRVIETEANVDEFDVELGPIPDSETALLRSIIDELSRPGVKDPKLTAAMAFLTDMRTGDGSNRRTWLEHGCLLFTQYYDTALWMATELSKMLPNELVGLYAGAGRCSRFVGGRSESETRERLLGFVDTRELRLMVATDAASEGLNLQKLGTLVNIDLPWNPARLEQRLGRIKRIGQRRSRVDMLNLVYRDTQDERVYEVLSQRMKDRYDLFGTLPDTIDAAWVDDEKKLAEQLDLYIDRRKGARNAFDIAHEDTVDPDAHTWEKCSRVFSRDAMETLLKTRWT